MQELKIPKDRIAVLVGTKGLTKRKLEKKTKTKILINSEDGDIIIEGDSLECYTSLKIIKAIGRGFNPEIAVNLIKEDMDLGIINIEDYSRDTENDVRRIKARLIGKNGKARSLLESLTNTNISVYGKTVSIIGDIENLETATQAVINLINGSKHGNVYAFIQKRRKISR